MRHLTLSLCAVVITFLAGVHSFAAQSRDSQQPAQVSLHRVAVQSPPDAPLRISSVVDNSDDPDAPLVNFMVENVSSKPIQAYWISYDTIAHGINVRLGSGLNATNQEMILPPGKRRATAVLNHDKEKISLSVGFIEFADGTTWGSDTAKYGESLAGERRGAQAEAQRLRKLLETGGVSAIVAAVSERELSMRSNHFSHSKSSSLIGARAMRLRVRRAYDQGGLTAVESALRQPYDMSTLSSAPIDRISNAVYMDYDHNNSTPPLPSLWLNICREFVVNYLTFLSTPEVHPGVMVSEVAHQIEIHEQPCGIH